MRKACTSAGTNYINIDYVQWLTGEAGIKKALADKSSCVQKDDNGNYYLLDDYYISNDSKKIRTFPLATNCKLQIVNWGDEDITIINVKINKFISTFKGEDNSMLVDINVVNGIAVALDEVYTP